MNNKVLSILQAVTPEEQRIMNGNDNIQRQIYTDADQFVVQWEKFLKPGEQIVVRKHTIMWRCFMLFPGKLLTMWRDINSQ